MEALIVLLLLIFLLVYFNIKKSHRESLEKLDGKIDTLLQETSKLKLEVRNLSKITPQAPQVTAKETPPPQPKPAPPQPVTPAYEPIILPKPIQPQNVVTGKEVPAPKYEPMHVIEEDSWTQKWLRNNPDLEKFIGENLVNKIGIAILVLGIGFFVKYAIDKHWINEVGRVCIGLFCGMLLTGLAHYMRNSYRSFSSVLAGGGIAVFYFTIALAFHQYHLLSQTAAFLIMVAVTAFAIALSLLYDKLELAVIAVVGGFLTPFMVSTGEGNYVILFTYLVILNSGLLALAFFKRWPLINVLAFLFTELIFGAWLVKTEWDQSKNISYPVALLFATILYLQFLAMNTVYQVKNKLEFRPVDYSLLLLLNGSYFAAGLALLSHVSDGQFQGSFTLGAGFINLLMAWYFLRYRQTYKPFFYLLIGLTITFLSLTIPIQLKGHAITLFWSAEFVLLFWLYQRSRISLFYFASLLVTALTIISLFMDWEKASHQIPTAIALIYTNLQGLVTNLVAVIAFASYAYLLTKEQERLPKAIEKKSLLQAYAIATVCVAYVTAIFGVNLLLRTSPNYEVPNVYHRLVTEAGAGIIIYWLYRKREHFKWLITGAVSAYVVYHLFSFAQIRGMRNGVLNGSYEMLHLVFHWLSVALALVLVFIATKFLQKAVLERSAGIRASWFLSILLLIFFSHEAAHLYVLLSPRQNAIDYLENQYLKAVLTVVWGVCSFGLMWLGMRYKNKTLRIISLSVFCIALLKLFFFDIANVSEGGKITAFILLGVLLLTISFMYQKLKKMLIDNEGR